MADGANILFTNPGNEKQIYSGLGDETPIEPLFFGMFFANHVGDKGHNEAIYVPPAAMAYSCEVARAATEDFDTIVIIILGRGFKAFASMQKRAARWN